MYTVHVGLYEGTCGLAEQRMTDKQNVVGLNPVSANVLCTLAKALRLT